MYDKLQAEARGPKSVEKLGKLRKSGFIPVVVFGKGIDSISLKVSELILIKQLAANSQIIEIIVDGKDKHLVNIENIQKDPVTGKLLHVSFHKLKKGQETTVNIPVALVGEAKGVTEGGLLNQQIQAIDVTGLPKDIPGSIEVDVTSLELNGTIYLKEITPPEGIKFNEEELENAVVSCAVPKVKEEPVVEEVATEEEAPAGDAPAEEAPADETKQEGANA